MVSLRRSRHLRQPSWNFFDTSNANSSVNSVSSSNFDNMSLARSESSASSQRRNTGFPESFCGNRNTSLPHPDADTSPNACITQEDISLSRVMSRHRRSFLARSNRTTSHGFLTPDMYNRGAMSHVTAPTATTAGGGLVLDPAIPRPGSGGGDSFASSSSTGEHGEDAKPDSPSQHRPRARGHSRVMSIDSNALSNKRTSFMDKLKIHKHHG